jgi:hypothetical protein
MFFLLVAAFAAVGFSAQKAMAQEKQEKKAAAAKELRLQGTIVRMSTDESNLDLQVGNAVRKVRFDSSTKWTRGAKAAERSEFEQGSFVIILGKEEKGEFLATRIDLRKPR